MVEDLATWLAQRGVDVEVVAEQGRALAHRLPAGHRWSYREQVATSRLHRAALTAAEVVLAARADGGVVLADGTCATPLVWHVCAARSRPGYDVGPPEVTEELLAAVVEDAYDLVLLTAADIPWEADGIRDDPDGRQAAFEEYRMLMPDAVLIEGPQRLVTAKRVVSDLLRMPSDLPG